MGGVYQELPREVRGGQRPSCSEKSGGLGGAVAGKPVTREVTHG